uniref:Putative secreted protein n=1 Tax=Panstrongylus lignarius TaxID=156445 RepID=A0A224Y1J3_9HEMI
MKVALFFLFVIMCAITMATAKPDPDRIGDNRRAFLPTRRNSLPRHGPPPLLSRPSLDTYGRRSHIGGPGRIPLLIPHRYRRQIQGLQKRPPAGPTKNL